MLAQSFMSAKELNLAEDERGALIQVLGQLERGEFHHISTYNGGLTTDVKRKMTIDQHTKWFNMGCWRRLIKECGSICCIGGATDVILGELRMENIAIINRDNLNDPFLCELFYPYAYGSVYSITVEQAASALRNYLTYHDPQWKTVLEQV